MCLYLSNSVGGAGNAPNAACSPEANRRAMQLHNGGMGGQARAAAFEAYLLREKVSKILNAKTELALHNDTSAASPSLMFKVGDIVQFTGGGVYTYSGAPAPKFTRGKSVCVVTQIFNGKHPYHLVSEDFGGVHGWVAAEDVTAVR